MRKVLFIVTSLNSGGIENYLLRFLRHYDGLMRPAVLCKNGCSGDLINEYRAIQFMQLPEFGLGYIDLGSYLTLYKFLKENEFDAICDFTGNFSALPLVTARLAKIPTRIAFYRGATNHFTGGVLKNAFNKIMNILVPVAANYILSNSEAALRFFFGDKWRDNPKYKVVYNGINGDDLLKVKSDLREELLIPPEAFVVGHVGRLDVAKNHKTIIEVAINLCKLYPDIYFVLCGKGVDVNLQARVEKEGLNMQIKLLGFRTDVPRVLNTLDCFYFPSLTEGQPNALIEAMVMGIPFVASNIEPIQETIPIGCHSQLIDPSDIGSAVRKILEIRMGGAGFADSGLSKWAINHFSANAQFEKFYNVLVSS